MLALSGGETGSRWRLGLPWRAGTGGGREVKVTYWAAAGHSVRWAQKERPGRAPAAHQDAASVRQSCSASMSQTIKYTSTLRCNKVILIGRCHRIKVSWFKNKHQHLSSGSKLLSQGPVLFNRRLLIKTIHSVATGQGIIIANIEGK